MTNRTHTLTRRITSPFGAFYLHLERAHPDAPVCEIGLSIPGTMHGKELGDVLLNLAAAINLELQPEDHPETGHSSPQPERTTP